jgi:hypothetical protein
MIAELSMTKDATVLAEAPPPQPSPQAGEGAQRALGHPLRTYEGERREPWLPSPACGGGWRTRQRATGGGSRHKFRYRMDPQCGPVRNDNKITEDTV